MTESGYELVKGLVNARATQLFHRSHHFSDMGDALIDLVVRLRNEGIEQMM
jgi:hypothetical protein